MRRRQQRGLETKQKILSTALKMFNEKGFNNVTVDEIVKETSTSKGAFYNHFRSKHDIFLEKFKEVDEYYIDVLYPSLNKFKTTTEKLYYFFEMQMTYLENDFGWDILRTIYEQELNVERDSFFLNSERPLHKILLILFEEGQLNNELRRDITTDEMIEIYYCIVRGLIYNWCITKGKDSLVDNHKLPFAFMMEGFKNK